MKMSNQLTIWKKWVHWFMKVPNFISGENRDSNELLDESIDGMQNHERKVIGSKAKRLLPLFDGRRRMYF